jgi:hypothetical protein
MLTGYNLALSDLPPPCRFHAAGSSNATHCLSQGWTSRASCRSVFCLREPRLELWQRSCPEFVTVGLALFHFSENGLPAKVLGQTARNHTGRCF